MPTIVYDAAFCQVFGHKSFVIILSNALPTMPVILTGL